MNDRLFHLQRINGIRTEWQLGEEVTITNSKHNIFYSGITNDLGDFIFQDDKKLGLIEASRQILNKIDNPEIYEIIDHENRALRFYDIIGVSENMILKMQISLIQYLKLIREEILEKIRIKDFNNLPSRKSCLWISKRDDLHVWHEELDSSNIRIKNGIVHQTDGNLINTETNNISYFEDSATKYWKGELSDNPKLECLFFGTFKVINIYNNLNDIK